VPRRRPLATWQLERTHAACVAADPARGVAFVGCATGDIYTIPLRGGPPIPAHIHRDRVNAMALLRDGDLVTVSDDGRLCISLGDRIDFDQSFSAKMRAVARAREADVFAVGDELGSVRVFAPQDGAWHQHSWKVHEGPVTAVALSHDGAIVLSAGADSGDVKVWNAGTGEPLGVLAGHTGPVLSIEISPDGRRALTGSVDTSIGVWDLASQRELGRAARQRRGAITALAVSEDGIYGIAGGLDRVVEVFDTGTLAPVEPFGVRATSAVRAAVFIPGARHALVMAGSGVVQRVEPGNPKVTANAPQAPTRDVTPWVLAASGAHVFAANRTALGEITSDGATRYAPFDTGPLTILSLASLGGARLVAGTQGGGVVVLDVTGSSIAPRWSGGHVGDTRVVVAGGGRILSGGEDGEAVLWDAATGDAIRRFPLHAEAILALALLPRERFLTAGEDGVVTCVDAATGALIARTVLPGEDRPTSLAASPDGATCFVGSARGVVRKLAIPSR
jgi:WD40 repeat protein